MSRFLLFLIAPGLLFAQLPRIGPVEIYGLRNVPEERVRTALGVSEGDRLPASRATLEERIEQVPGIDLVRIEAVCCTGDRAALYVGIEESGARHLLFHDPPGGPARLPKKVVESYRSYLREFELAARRNGSYGNPGQVQPAADPGIRRSEAGFRRIARERLALLRDVLRSSGDPEHRAIAAAVIAYAPNPASVIADLQHGLRDADEGVRANAVRGLGEIAAPPPRGAAARIPAADFTSLLDSIVRSDRCGAAQALVNLTSARPAAIADVKGSVPALLEMARWKTPAHAHAAFVLLGRMAGLSGAEIEAAWANKRASVLERFPQK